VVFVYKLQLHASRAITIVFTSF